jgi:hypothetical protein
MQSILYSQIVQLLMKRICSGFRGNLQSVCVKSKNWQQYTGLLRIPEYEIRKRQCSYFYNYFTTALFCTKYQKVKPVPMAARSKA